MTRFTVVWQNEALADAASSWLDAVDRKAVAASTHAIDHEPADDPSNKGEELREGLRALDIPPSRAIYEVDQDDRMVVVQRLRLLIK